MSSAPGISHWPSAWHVRDFIATGGAPEAKCQKNEWLPQARNVDAMY